ncbi:MAG: hypothetical protein methR_P0203 [Methyloprofundus sp.]|nr:MAG: hypothetical protein methR_P0203 [Methyloprofundus sp.]
MNKSLITLGSLIFSINVAQAESTYFKQTLGANIGYFFTDINNSAKLHGSIGESGDSLSFEKDLGLNDRVNTFKADIFWRITPKHRLDFTWFGLFQDGQTLTTEELTIGDNIIPAGTGITSKFNHNRFQLNYTYNLFQGANYELGPSLGVYTININTEIRPSIGNESIETYASSNLTLPLPVVGLRGSYGITDNLIVLSNFDFMIAKIGDWEGEIYSYQLAFEYNFIKYVGIGVAYNFSLLNVENNREHYKFRYDYEYHGVQTYLKFAF